MLFIGLKIGPEPLCKQQLLGLVGVSSLFGSQIHSYVLWDYFPICASSSNTTECVLELMSAHEQRIVQEPSVTASVRMQNNPYECMEN